MRIQRINNISVYQKTHHFPDIKANETRKCSYNALPVIYYAPVNISFGLENSQKLKKLFEYGVPCIYTGVEMIDPKKFQKQMKAGVFSKDASTAIRILEKYNKTYTSYEKRMFQLLKFRSLFSPNSTIKDLVSINEPLYEKILVKKQLPILNKIQQLSQNLPSEYQIKMEEYISNSYKKINKQPVIKDFSTVDFIYKLKKISADEDKTTNTKAASVMAKLMSETKKLELKTTPDTIENQKKVIDFMEVIRKKSCIKNNEQLKKLIKDSQDCLNKKPVILPFTRKSFIYDISKILESLPDTVLKQEILNVADTLPTSQNSFAAYVVKVSKESSDKIVYRIAWPFFASIEHLLPRSCGGANNMENYAGACTRANSQRESIDFTEQIKRVPQTAKYCQKYVNRLIQLAHEGKFEKINLDINYIENFKKTIERLSKNKIILDISKLYS